MSTQKPLPKNLKQLEQKPRFKQLYKQHTVEQLEEKLIEAEIEYGSDENKAALVWRYMDAKGMSFDDVAINGQDDAQKAPTEPNDDQKEVINDQPPAPTNDETTDHEQAKAPVSTNDDSLPTIDGSGEKQSGTSGDNTTKQPDNKPAAPVAVNDDRECIEVTNNGAYNFYETATGTMVKARQATKIYTTATIDKAHILRNINQYNQTRGNLLQITN